MIMLLDNNKQKKYYPFQYIIITKGYFKKSLITILKLKKVMS